MNDNQKTQLKEYLLNYVSEVTEPSPHGGKNQFVCPLCGSGNGKNGTGAFTYYPATNSYHCFACDADGDIFTLYGAVNGIRDFKTIADELSSKTSRCVFLFW